MYKVKLLSTGILKLGLWSNPPSKNSLERLKEFTIVNILRLINEQNNNDQKYKFVLKY